jgi:hypothetical protein
MKIFYFLIILASTSCSVYSNVHAISWSHIFNKSMTTIHWGILILPALAWAGNQIAGSDNLKKYPDASLELTNFIQKELRKNGCPEELINNIQIKIGDRFQAGYILDNKHVITIPAIFKDYANLLPEHKLGISFLTRHEVAHLENKDMWRQIIVCLAAPFVAHSIVSAGLYPFTCLLKPYIPITIQSIFQIPSAFLKLGIAGLLILVFAKYKEYQADKKAALSIHNLEILEHMKKIFLITYSKYELHHKLNQEERENFLRFVYDEIHTPDPAHPNYLFRAKVLDNAIKNHRANNCDIK